MCCTAALLFACATDVCGRGVCAGLDAGCVVGDAGGCGDLGVQHVSARLLALALWLVRVGGAMAASMSAPKLAWGAGWGGTCLSRRAGWGGRRRPNRTRRMRLRWGEGLGEGGVHGERGGWGLSLHVLHCRAAVCVCH